MSEYDRCLKHAARSGMPAAAAAEACRDSGTARCLAFCEGDESEHTLDNFYECYGRPDAGGKEH